MGLISTTFKQTKVGEIPHDWKVTKVNDLLELLTDYDANGSFASVAENVKVYNRAEFAWYVRSTDLENNSNLNSVKYVDKDSYDFLKKTALYGGELLFLKRGDIGRVYLFEMKTDHATVAPNLYLLKLNNLSNSTYLYYFFQSNLGQGLLKSKNASSTLGALYKDDVKSIEIPLPPTIEEQKAIAQVLSDTDSLIQALEKKIAKKKLIKKGVMQRLLEPREGWGEYKLGQIVEFYKGKGLSKGKISSKGKYPCLLYGELFTTYKEVIEKVISRTEFLEGVLSKSGDVLMPGSTTTSGIDLAIASALKVDNVLLGGDINVLRPKVEINSEFLSRYLTNNKKTEIVNETQGITIIHLYGHRLKNLIIKVPMIETQNHITKILSDIDKEIELLEQKLSKYQLAKQGMMQQLLTGKIRLV
jgi:type I restriction enzyme S subunit